MSEFRGTPGPYETRPMGDVLAPNGEILAHCYQPDATKGTKVGEDEREWNAELFAASWDLLQALQSLVGNMDYLDWASQPDGLEERVRSVIAKALGHPKATATTGAER